MLLSSATDSRLEIPGFLSAAECAELIARSEQRGFAEAGVLTPTGAQMIKGIRNNYRLEYPDPMLAADLWTRLAPHLPIEADEAAPIGLYEQFRFYRYDVGQRFNRHKDGSIQVDKATASRWTLLLYLNNDFEGGATEFDDQTIVPRQGAALAFRHELRHKGCLVTAGRKYVLRTDVLYRTQ